jgi:hypothetical protein
MLSSKTKTKNGVMFSQRRGGGIPRLQLTASFLSLVVTTVSSIQPIFNIGVAGQYLGDVWVMDFTTLMYTKAEIMIEVGPYTD